MATKNSSLKTMVLQTLARFRKKLESITPRVKGSNTFSAIPSPIPQTISLSRALRNYPPDKPLDYSVTIVWLINYDPLL